MLAAGKSKGEDDEGGGKAKAPAAPVPPERLAQTVTVTHGNQSYKVGHGAVVIAAITSCTNTSNPAVLVGAGLLAKKAVERGLTPKPWVKTSLAPGSRVVTEYLKEAGLLPYLEARGLPRGGLRVHHVHRQLGPAAGSGGQRGDGGRPGGGGGAVGQPQLRGPHQPARADELPGLAAAGGGVRAGR